ncbi:mycothiol synthase [Pseudonocardia sp. HH130630-07]|uniref:mycothiol synthase n=1 Tax=Pseudonocardia sp. HH130630-07 TaxID=1690815 RepID=UPI000814F979|nr:mycothiol synthase [Pseudonocardia sp. HH130630-07]ANY06403.1 mycothiol synthase [Pseudonocardia sp. HH130630-07]
MDPQVLTRPDADTTAAVHDLLAAAASADGIDPFSEQFLLTLRATEPRDGVRHVVVAGNDRPVAGYAQLDGEYAELVVHPDERRRGIGSALVTALDGLSSDPHVWAHGDLDAARALAEARGYRRDRVLWQMRRTASGPPPEVVVPDGVTVRPFVPGRDDEEFLRVNNAAFDWHPEQGGWTGRELAARQAEDWFDADGFLLATDPGGTLLGYHWTKVHPATGDEPAMGEVYVLGVDPAAHGRGLGGMLTAAGLRHLHDRGLDTVLLYVEADNAPAVRVYERLGFTVHAADVNYAR